MPHTTVSRRRRPARPGAPTELRALEFVDGPSLEEQVLLEDLAESGVDLRRVLAVLAETVAGVMHGTGDPLSAAIDVLEEFSVPVPEPAARTRVRVLGVAA